MELLYRPALLAARAVLRARGLVLDVRGAEHVPRGGALVAAGNHVSETDPFMAAIALDAAGRRPRFLAKQELFDTPALGALLRHLKQVPVDRWGEPAMALPRALLLLDAGEAVVLFPEGTTSPSLVPGAPKQGAARLALASGATLLPFAVWGGQRVGNPERPVHRRDRVVLVVRFGPPVPYRRGEPVAAVTARLWESVHALVDALQRSYPQEPAGPEDRWWVPAHLGGTAPTVEEAADLVRRRAAERAERAAAAAGRRRAPTGDR